MLRAGTAPAGGAGLEKASDRGRPSSADEPLSPCTAPPARDALLSTLSPLCFP